MSKSFQPLALQCGNLAVIQDTKHPNKMVLKGVLVRLDEPSTKAPNGSDGHRILVPSAVAKARLSSLIGMGINYAPDLKGHAQRRKVGVIEKAWIDGKDVCVQATIWKHDFPEAERDLKQAGLGMSMELGDVQVEDDKASIWKLSDFCFLGATVLYRDAAAYNRTRAIAASKDTKRSVSMAKTNKVAAQPERLTGQRIAEIAGTAAATAVASVLAGQMNRQNKTLASVAAILQRMEVRAAGSGDEDGDENDLDVDLTASDNVDDEAACDAKMKASKKKDDGDDEDEDDDEDMEGSEDHGIEEGSLEDMGEANDDDEDDPGHLSKDAKNKGDKTTSEDKVGKHVASQAAKENRELRAENEKLRLKLRRYSKQIKAVGEQRDRDGRKSMALIPAELRGLLEKGNVDVGFLQASEAKMTVAEFDAVLSQVPGLDVQKRMELKNVAHKNGILEDGVVTRGR